MDSFSKIILIIISSFLFSKIPVMGLDLRQITENTKDQKQELSKESYMPIVRILTPASSGSGVVLGRKNNIYTLITAKHVIRDYLDDQKDEIEIKIAPNIFIKPLEVITPFENKDIAFLKFHSVSYIKLAILPFLDKPLWEKVSDWESINVQGFANESFGVKEATFRKASGKLLAFLEKVLL